MSGRRAILDCSSHGLVVASIIVAGLLGRPARAGAMNGYNHACHVRQAVTAPAPAPIQRPPRFEQGIFAMGVESFTSTWARAKGRLEGQGYDLYGAREQISGYLVLAFQRWLSLGFSFEAALPSSELRPIPGPLGPPPSASGGGGLQVGFHFRLSRRVRLDFVSDLWLYGLVYRMRLQRPTEIIWGYEDAYVCPPPDLSVASFDDETTLVFVLRSQLSLGVDLGPVRLVAAIGLRNVPHHITGGSASWNDTWVEPREVHTVYPYLWIGVALPLGHGLSATIGLAQPLWADPVGYAPGIGVGLHLEAGELLEGRQ